MLEWKFDGWLTYYLTVDGNAVRSLYYCFLAERYYVIRTLRSAYGIARLSSVCRL